MLMQSIGMRRFKKNYTVICLLGLVMAGGLVAYWHVYVHPRYAVHLTPSAELAISRREASDESPPTADETRAYVVSPEAPRYLSIERLGIVARVLQLGKAVDGKIAAPAGIWDVGWYEASQPPGEPGVSFIDGHISGPTLRAVFTDLHM